MTPRGIVFGNYIRITRDACISLVFLFLFLFVRIMTRCTSFPSSPFFFPLRLALKIDPPFDLDLGFFFLSRGETRKEGDWIVFVRDDVKEEEGNFKIYCSPRKLAARPCTRIRYSNGRANLFVRKWMGVRNRGGC